MTLYFDMGAFAHNADRELLDQIPQRVAAITWRCAGARRAGDRCNRLPGKRGRSKYWNACCTPLNVRSPALKRPASGHRPYLPAMRPGAPILVWTDEREWSEAVIKRRALWRALDQGCRSSIVPPAGRGYGDCAATGVLALVTHVSDDAARMRLVRRSPTSSCWFAANTPDR
jgi:hypothetical protein